MSGLIVPRHVVNIAKDPYDYDVVESGGTYPVALCHSWGQDPDVRGSVESEVFPFPYVTGFWYPHPMSSMSTVPTSL